MNRRIGKQIVIATVFLLIGTLVVFVVWRISMPSPSCTDGIRNQDEEDVDCGGVCGACGALPQLPTAGDPALLVGPDGLVDVTFDVENQNPQWGIIELPYTVTLLDLDGSALVEREGSTFVMPLGSHIVVEHAISGASNAVSAEVALGDASWVEPPRDAASADLSVLSPTYKRNPDSFSAVEVSGIIRNDSPFSYDVIEVHVAVKDRLTGEVVGARRTEMRTLTSGERREFSVTWRSPLLLTGEPELVINPLTNIFQNDNFIREYGELERFQEFE